MLDELQILYFAVLQVHNTIDKCPITISLWIALISTDAFETTFSQDCLQIKTKCNYAKRNPAYLSCPSVRAQSNG